MPALVTLLLAIHLLAMNIAAGAPLLAAWLVTHRGANDAGLTAGRRLARLGLESLAAGILLGCVLLAAPAPALRAALGRFSATAYWFAGAELLFSLVCGTILLILARSKRRRPVLVWLVAIASSTNLLYHFPPLMIVIGRLAAAPTWTTSAFVERRELVSLSLRPEVLAMWIHFVLASLAVTAIAVLWRESGGRHEAGPADAAAEAGVTKRLAAIGMAATALQLPVGAWVLVASPTSVREALLGQNIVASALFLAGVVAALMLMQSLTAPLLGDATLGARRAPAAWALIVVVSMTATLRASAPRAGERAAAPAATATTYSPAAFGSTIKSLSSPPGSLPSAIKAP